MIANDILLDAFTRVHESLHRTLRHYARGTGERAASVDRVACLAHQSSDGQQCITLVRPRAVVDRRRMGCPIRYAARTGGLRSIGETHARASQVFPRFGATREERYHE
jgi:hypothetical protein